MPIYKEGNKWKIENVPGSHDTREEALAQLQAIEINKKRRHERKRGRQ